MKLYLFCDIIKDERGNILPFKEKTMSTQIDTATQASFLPSNLPPTTEGFYNSSTFVSNEFKFLGAQMSDMTQQLQQALQQLNPMNQQS